jgi:hypothetical protein
VCNATGLDKEIERSYINSDYAATAKLLEKKIDHLKEKAPAGHRGIFQEIYMNKLLLAHIYAWKLAEPERSLKIYEVLIQLKRSQKERIKIPPLEFLYIAELYEVKNDLPRAEKHYQVLLEELSDLKEREHDDVSVIMFDELTIFVKYQIDGIRLKHNGEKLLKKLKLSSLMIHNIAPFLSMGLVPTARYEAPVAMKTDLPSYIKQSTTNISSMVFGYTLLLNAAGGSVDESSEKAMEAYLSKYPEGYFSLSLRYLFYKFYQESAQKQKADKLLAELESIAQKRKMELIVGPDKRFSSPEKTWETYKKALIAGDLDLAMECHIPGNNKYRGIFSVLGKDEMKKMAKKMNPIGKITLDEMRAKYRITRDHEGNEITYYIYFSNINGEWKIEQY